jgi:hypothetical protein
VAGKRVTIAAVYDNNDSYSLTTSDIKDLQALEEKEQAFKRLRASSTLRGGWCHEHGHEVRWLRTVNKG